VLAQAVSTTLKQAWALASGHDGDAVQAHQAEKEEVLAQLEAHQQVDSAN
jgi:hypothetical protein